MKLSLKPIVTALLTAIAATAFAQSSAQESQLAQTETQVKKLGTITVTGNQPTSLPTQIPTTIEGITGKEIAEKINAFDSEDALKYFPSLLVRKSYVGDYDHAGRITDLGGTGWNTLSARGVWRPGTTEVAMGDHVVEFGYQDYASKLRTLVSDTGDWRSAPAGARFSAFKGDTDLQGLFAQDTWTISPQWRTTFGVRWERWHAFGGEIGSASLVQKLSERTESSGSPKLALAYQATPDWTIKGSVGRAVRTPTVAELYQGSISATTIVNNDPNLKAEKSWTSELTAERQFGWGNVRGTAFFERTKDALFSQTNVSVTPNVTNIQNVDAIRTHGIELALQAADVGAQIGFKGLDVTSSVTWTHSVISANSKFPASVGKWQPRVPDWRANVLATFRANDRWSLTGGLRYSGTQYGTLDNTDLHGATYTGVSKFLVADVRARYHATKSVTVSAGIDNLNNEKYWAFHPYTQRMFVLELKADF